MKENEETEEKEHEERKRIRIEVGGRIQEREKKESRE